jgi:hypothetical protein
MRRAVDDIVTQFTEFLATSFDLNLGTCKPQKYVPASSDPWIPLPRANVPSAGVDHSFGLPKIA